MRILGVDPGLGITGYGVVEGDVAAPRLLEAGAIRSGSRRELPERLVVIHNAWSFAPREVKNAIVGHGGASKEQVQAMVQSLFGLAERPRPHDVADALALALTGLHRASRAIEEGIGHR